MNRLNNSPTYGGIRGIFGLFFIGLGGLTEFQITPGLRFRL